MFGVQGVRVQDLDIAFEAVRMAKEREREREREGGREGETGRETVRARGGEKPTPAIALRRGSLDHGTACFGSRVQGSSLHSTACHRALPAIEHRLPERAREGQRERERGTLVQEVFLMRWKRSELDASALRRGS